MLNSTDAKPREKKREERAKEQVNKTIGFAFGVRNDVHP